MTDSTDGPTERASAESAPASGDGRRRKSKRGSLDLGRRELLAGIGVLAVGGTGGFLATSGGESEESTYILRQGYLRYEVDPIREDGGEMNVEEFYDYQRRQTSASPADSLIEEDAASRMFIYDGPVDSSLVFLHGSPDVEHGGRAVFSFSGLSRDQGEWAVRDDPTDIDDDFQPWEGGNQKVAWGWGEHKTDGGAYWGVLDRQDVSISITPKTLRGVDAWKFFSGEVGDLESHELYQEKPVKLRPADGRTVQRANIDIMPDAEENEFDPYSNEMLTVAVEDPPEGVDESEWVGPEDLDPGNYSVNFGSKRYLAGENAAQPQKYFERDGTLYLNYKTKAANFSLESAYGYLVSKVDEKTYVRGRDTVRPGGFDNVDEDEPELVVADLHIDPAGDDETPNDEYVEFGNDGDSELDLTGYTIRDEEGSAFDVPDGVVLGADETVRLYTGTGDRTRSELYWGLDREVWDDGGDTVVVVDSNAETVLEYTYPRA